MPTENKRAFFVNNRKREGHADATERVPPGMRGKVSLRRDQNFDSGNFYGSYRDRYSGQSVRPNAYTNKVQSFVTLEDLFG